ncbi:MAG: glycosyltransferase family protein [Burkholderiaceae bacterium]|nr:glycosyltransferase family protein [Burkholderiaceae bacterium]
MNTATIIIQARMESTRLPGKVLAPIAGRPMLSYQIERLRRCRTVDRIVVATTTLPADNAIVALCDSEGVECTRGSKEDVLSRYAHAARTFNASTVVRVTSDCPLIEPTLVEDAIAMFLSGDSYDYLSNMIEPTWPYGMAVEVMSRKALDEAHAEARDLAEREHVTPFLYWRPKRYRLKSLTMQPDLSEHRWTVDTREDLELVAKILTTLYPRKPDFDMNDVLSLLQDNPSWVRINRHVQQKSVVPTSKGI